MSFTLNAVLSLFIGAPVLVGWLRFRKIDPVFLPFLLALSAGLVSEIASIVLILQKITNAPVFNLYSLLESIFLLWQFRRWQVIPSRVVYYLLQALLAAVWFWDSFLYGNPMQFNSAHLIVYASVVTVLSLDMMNRVIYRYPGVLLKNTAFLLCTGLLVFHVYTILVELSWLYGASEDTSFRIRLLSLLSYVNLFCNLLFTLALLWAPTHYRYLMRSLAVVR